jgi:hypothetical protein
MVWKFGEISITDDAGEQTTVIRNERPVLRVVQ